ncbi:hypothetical protein EI94DRAFT_1746208 [Lactarius quietus]|nr:hypothetical protein EI94DRAFT_1746208 [Lactarius quietus]
MRLMTDAMVDALRSLLLKKATSPDDPRIQSLRRESGRVLQFASFFSFIFIFSLSKFGDGVQLVEHSQQMVNYPQQNFPASSIASQFSTRSHRISTRTSLLWSLSLVCTIFCAIFVTLVKQWVQDMVHDMYHDGRPIVDPPRRGKSSSEHSDLSYGSRKNAFI